MATAHGAAHDHRCPRARRPPHADRLASLRLQHQPQGHRHDVPCVLDLRRPDRRHLLGGHAARAAAARRAVLQQSRRHAQRPSVEHRGDGARPDHGVLRRHAGADRRVRQLVRAADDRRARHGLPAHEQHQLLAAAAGLHPAARLGRDRRRRRHRLDDLSASLEQVRARAWISPSSRCTLRARRRSWAPSTSSPRSSTCARRA